MDMLQLEVAKAKVREDIKADLEQRKEGIKQIGEEVGGRHPLCLAHVACHALHD